MEGSEKLTLQVAELAKLELSKSELSEFTSQIQEILKYVEKLQKIDVSQVEPMIHPIDLASVLRDDQVYPSPKDSDGTPLILKSAPDVLSGGFKVPPIL